MKSIINGKLYNTETAEYIHGISNGRSGNDVFYFEEDLYRTKKGQFFICYDGGPMSKYGKWEGQQGYGTNGIKLLTEDEAKTWLEENNVTEKYMELFEGIEEG